MAIAASLVKELRERTGLGILDCRNALAESDGDVDLAIDTLRKASGMKAAKKAGRIASDGLIGMKIAEDGKRAVMVEVNCETDFAARDENFLGFMETVTDQIFKSGETDISKLLESGLESTRERLVQKIGENCSIRRAECFEGSAASYIHNNGKIGVLVAMEGGSESLRRDIAMHIAAIGPAVISPDDVQADVIAKEREIYTAQAKDSGKPPEIIEKIIEGRIRKYLAEISLTEQPFVKDKDIKISALLSEAGAKVNRFVRFEVGEGIDKDDDDFAAEVARQVS
ncbi:MAG: elongation factor Ts [Proteobacteria bacterium]|nr:elongation factor Ts [Pseudomonadota bacterium]MCH8257801.1 elongation factor Ts [Pseudomonadota bacterium]